MFARALMLADDMNLLTRSSMRVIRCVLPLVCILLAANARSQDLRMLLDLRGKWKFEIGDNMSRSSAAFDDKRWDEINVPSPWEDEGFAGYDGYAWYRKHIRVQKEWAGKVLYLVLGNVDDVDEVYVNGQMIGLSGSFPPNYITAYNGWRQYRLLSQYLNPDGDNVIAVRVFDAELSGGIIRGKIGIYEMTGTLQPDFPLGGAWKFRTGDDRGWKEPDADDRHWKTITVPAYWETQGYKDYDGYGWYRTRFTVPAEVTGQRFVLVLGKIDDFDETYLNGQLLGRTGSFPAPGATMPFTNDYLQLRAYVIPPEMLNRGSENVLAVRVYDGFLQGGIYDGPIGLVTRERYQQWKEHQDRSRSGIWKIIDWIFR
jgi:hypothetical protein